MSLLSAWSISLDSAFKHLLSHRNVTFIVLLIICPATPNTWRCTFYLLIPNWPTVPISFKISPVLSRITSVGDCCHQREILGPYSYCIRAEKNYQHIGSDDGIWRVLGWVYRVKLCMYERRVSFLSVHHSQTWVNHQPVTHLQRRRVAGGGQTRQAEREMGSQYFGRREK